MTTIQLSEETLHELRVRKAQFGDKSYNETIRHLLGERHDIQHVIALNIDNFTQEDADDTGIEEKEY